MGIFHFFKNKDINLEINEYNETAGAILLDVRTPQEYKEGHIPNSLNIPLQTLSEVASILPYQDVPLFVYCRRGSRNKRATQILKQMGYKKVKNIGGIMDYKGKVDN